jgi:hypothetical protein
VQIVKTWRDILKRAWSVRFMALAAIFSGLEVAVPLLEGILPVSRGEFAILSGLCTAAALVARVVAQRDLPEA